LHAARTKLANVIPAFELPAIAERRLLTRARVGAAAIALHTLTLFGSPVVARVPSTDLVAMSTTLGTSLPTSVAQPGVKLTPVASPEPKVPGSALSMVALVPRRAVTVIWLPDGSRVLAPVRKPPLLAAWPILAGNSATVRSVATLATRLQLSVEETIDALLGGQCMVVIEPGVPAAGAGAVGGAPVPVAGAAPIPAPAWTFIADISAETAQRLRERLDAFPREIIAGQTVLSIENGAYALLLHKPADPPDARRAFRVLITPTGTDSESRLRSMLPVAVGKSAEAAPPNDTLGGTEAMARFVSAIPDEARRGPLVGFFTRPPASEPDWTSSLSGLLHETGDRVVIELVSSDTPEAPEDEPRVQREGALEMVRGASLPASLPRSVFAALPERPLLAIAEMSWAAGRTRFSPWSTRFVQGLALPGDDAGGFVGPRKVSERGDSGGAGGASVGPPALGTRALVIVRDETTGRVRIDAAQFLGDEAPNVDRWVWSWARGAEGLDRSRGKGAQAQGRPASAASPFDPMVLRGLDPLAERRVSVRPSEGPLQAAMGNEILMTWRQHRSGWWGVQARPLDDGAAAPGATARRSLADLIGAPDEAPMRAEQGGPAPGIGETLGCVFHLEARPRQLVEALNIPVPPLSGPSELMKAVSLVTAQAFVLQGSSGAGGLHWRIELEMSREGPGGSR
jgi:hypothetical protein